MQIKVLNIGVVKKDNKILMRKKPDGSKPYKETWYSFGGIVEDGINPNDALKEMIYNQTNIIVKVIENISWDTEIKEDHDGVLTQFIYLNSICEFVSGELEIKDNNIEKLDFIEMNNLSDYDIVPPSVKLFKELGYIK